MEFDLTRDQALTLCKAVHYALETLLITEHEKQAFVEAQQAVLRGLRLAEMIQAPTPVQRVETKRKPVAQSKSTKGTFYNLADAIKRSEEEKGETDWITLIDPDPEQNRGYCIYQAGNKAARVSCYVDEHEDEQFQVTIGGKAWKPFTHGYEFGLVYEFRVGYGIPVSIVVTAPTGKKEVVYVFQQNGVEEQSQGIGLTVYYDRLGSEAAKDAGY